MKLPFQTWLFSSEWKYCFHYFFMVYFMGFRFWRVQMLKRMLIDCVFKVGRWLGASPFWVFLFSYGIFWKSGNSILKGQGNSICIIIILSKCEFIWLLVSEDSLKDLPPFPTGLPLRVAPAACPLRCQEPKNMFGESRRPRWLRLQLSWISVTRNDSSLPLLILYFAYLGYSSDLCMICAVCGHCLPLPQIVVVSKITHFSLKLPSYGVVSFSPLRLAALFLNTTWSWTL